MTERNQCDGCARGLPINANGNHYEGPGIEFHSAGYFHPDAVVCSAKQAEALWRENAELRREVESLRAFKRGVDEALNSGDGSYRP